MSEPDRGPETPHGESGADGRDEPAAEDTRPGVPPVQPVSDVHPAPCGPPHPPRAGGDRATPPSDVASPLALDHQALKSLLGAWALAACPATETAAVEAHLTNCAGCAEEALRLRDAVGLLRTEDSLDLDPLLRTRVLTACLARRPARIPVPWWARPYDAETARLDALLRDMAPAEWRAPVELRWSDGEHEQTRSTTVTGVIGHLLAVDGLIATALDLPDPLGDAAPHRDPTARTEAYWRSPERLGGPAVRDPWREQSRTLVHTVSTADARTADTPVTECHLPMSDAFLHRAFACWVHATDIASAIDYPYVLPAGEHLNLLVDLAARHLPSVLATRRRTGLAAPPRRLTTVGAPGRTLHLEVEGHGGGHWHIPLDSPAATTAPDRVVARVALDGTEFCQLAAGHVPPREAAAGQEGDPEAIHDVLAAMASLSQL